VVGLLQARPLAAFFAQNPRPITDKKSSLQVIESSTSETGIPAPQFRTLEFVLFRPLAIAEGDEVTDPWQLSQQRRDSSVHHGRSRTLPYVPRPCIDA